MNKRKCPGTRILAPGHGVVGATPTRLASTLIPIFHLFFERGKKDPLLYSVPFFQNTPKKCKNFLKKFFKAGKCSLTAKLYRQSVDKMNRLWHISLVYR